MHFEYNSGLARVDYIRSRFYQFNKVLNGVSKFKTHNKEEGKTKNEEHDKGNPIVVSDEIVVDRHLFVLSKL